MNFCICCHTALLRHIRHRDIYWYCPECRQEMPSLEIVSGNPLKKPAPVSKHFSPNFSTVL